MRDYKRAFNCIDYLIKFVDSIDNPSRGASNIMIDKQGETIMKTDLGYWYEGNEQLREYLRKKSVEENEIKAIPIEWIEKWINSKTKIWVNPKYADTVFTDVPVDYYENFTPYQVIAMLEDWEKENE